MGLILTFLASVGSWLFEHLFLAKLFAPKSDAQQAVDAETKIAQVAAQPVARTDIEKDLRDGSF